MAGTIDVLVAGSRLGLDAARLDDSRVAIPRCEEDLRGSRPPFHEVSGGSSMKVFVAGASGAIGRHLIPALVRAGHSTTPTPLRSSARRRTTFPPSSAGWSAARQPWW
jgi:hypothetical protein